MKVTVIGSGYVGLVTGACLAQVGHQVICYDLDAEKIADLQQGICPIFEPGLAECMAHSARFGHLRFSANAAESIQHADVIFIAVGTPPTEDGSADTRHVLAAAETVGHHLQDNQNRSERPAIVVTKSTVPVGTTEAVKTRISQVLSQRGANIPFDIASNPEFLKEGAAIADFMKPDRIVIGTDSPRVVRAMRELYAAFNRNRDRIMVMDIPSAELTKYAANAMLATKISFINEMANIAETLGADIEQVRQGIGADPRIGYHFIYPGCGYGGSCFPKDVNALETTALNTGYRPQLLKAVREVNLRQRELLFKKISRYFQGDLRDKTFALWGLAFKPGTDDMREAPSRFLMEALWQGGARVKAFDPEAMEMCRSIYGERSNLILANCQEEAAQDADALIICTEWKTFWSPDFSALKTALKQPVIFDGRNLFDPAMLADQGFDYFGIGRGHKVGLRERKLFRAA